MGWFIINDIDKEILLKLMKEEDMEITTEITLPIKVRLKKEPLHKVILKFYYDLEILLEECIKKAKGVLSK